MNGFLIKAHVVRSTRIEWITWEFCETQTQVEKRIEQWRPIFKPRNLSIHPAKAIKCRHCVRGIRPTGRNCPVCCGNGQEFLETPPL